jgi:predicted ribosomally synthesized peptide with SipW-like signal peptide
MRSFKKMGLLFMVLVIALAGLGVGFAAWTDSITITGTVTTGSVDLEVEGYSGMWVYKDLLFDVDPIITTAPMVDPAGNDYLLVASSWAEAGPGAPGADVIMTWNNLFPLPEPFGGFQADVVLHYNGTIPAKVNQVLWAWTGDPGLELLYFDATATIISTLDGSRIGDIVDVGYQLHYCDTIELVVTLDVPQNNDLMNLSGTAKAFIEVVQWNEYPY